MAESTELRLNIAPSRYRCCWCRKHIEGEELLMHLASEFEYFPYSCIICSQGFTDISHAYQHCLDTKHCSIRKLSSQNVSVDLLLTSMAHQCVAADERFIRRNAQVIVGLAQYVLDTAEPTRHQQRLIKSLIEHIAPLDAAAVAEEFNDAEMEDVNHQLPNGDVNHQNQHDASTPSEQHDDFNYASASSNTNDKCNEWLGFTPEDISGIVPHEDFMAVSQALEEAAAFGEDSSLPIPVFPSLNTAPATPTITNGQARQYPHVNGESSSKKKTMAIACHLCQKTMLRSSLWKHLRTVHGKTSSEDLYCSECQKYFSSLYNMNRHFKEVHEKVPRCAEPTPRHLAQTDDAISSSKSYHCNLCSSRVTSLDSIRRHIRKVHQRTALVGCNYSVEPTASSSSAALNKVRDIPLASEESIVNGQLNVKLEELEKLEELMNDGRKVEELMNGSLPVELNGTNGSSPVDGERKGFTCKLCSHWTLSRRGMWNHIRRFHGEPRVQLGEHYEDALEPPVQKNTT